MPALYAIDPGATPKEARYVLVPISEIQVRLLRASGTLKPRPLIGREFTVREVHGTPGAEQFTPDTTLYMLHCGTAMTEDLLTWLTVMELKEREESDALS